MLIRLSRGERPGRARTLGVVIGFVGLTLLMHGRLSYAAKSLVGDVLGVVLHETVSVEMVMGGAIVGATALKPDERFT